VSAGNGKIKTIVVHKPSPAPALKENPAPVKVSVKNPKNTTSFFIARPGLLNFYGM